MFFFYFFFFKSMSSIRFALGQFMNINLHFITKSENRRAFHIDLCSGGFTTDRTMEILRCLVKKAPALLSSRLQY